MRVKICGLTTPMDAALAVACGASELGCVLAPGTPRAVSAHCAGRILAEAPPGVARLLVFRSASAAEVESAAAVAGVREVQLHRSEPALDRALAGRGLRVRRVFEEPFDWPEIEAAARVHPCVLDVGGGGSGRRFDWTRLAGRDLAGVTIAGGITPGNVVELLPFRPGGIDVSSGVESAPGRKDPARLRRLFGAIADIGEASA